MILGLIRVAMFAVITHIIDAATDGGASSVCIWTLRSRIFNSVDDWVYRERFAFVESGLITCMDLTHRYKQRRSTSR
jgi:hypothetical protein